jgi:CubicO group peptidase (beta-lactamase class C family)
VGSLCKSITGTVATIAEQDGDINLARPITDFLPRLSLLSGGRLRTASLVVLLDMRAGMTQAVHYRGLELDPPGLDGDAFVDRFSLAPVREARSYSYSNMGPELVARAIAAATGRDFATYAERKLFSPLGMTSTYFSAAEVPEARRAQSYKQSMKPFKRLFETDPRAGAGCLTSARDLSAYMIFHLTGRSPSATTLLSEANLDSDHAPASGGFYRRGWGRVLAGDHAILISDGQINGGQAVILLDPAKRAGAAVLTNVVYDDVYDIAASALNEMDPGIAVSFANAFSALRRDRERELASVYPPPGAWSAQGTLIADGRSHHLAVTNARDFLSIQIDGGVQIRATDDGRDDGFMKWSLPCAKFLPLCIEGTKADADLYLTRDGDALAGVIAVDSLLGLFPYEVRLRPAPR